MANTKFQYVREFERDTLLLPNTWLVVRVDGNGFSEFVRNQRFKKPMDARGVNLMVATAEALCLKFREVRMAFGQSDEFSFVLPRKCGLWKRREAKLVSSFASFFAAAFVFLWPRFFGDEPLLEPPAFDARVVCFPSDVNLRDYLSWRQADTHINHLLNCCFWALVEVKRRSPDEAQKTINGTSAAQKNEMLFAAGINYNEQPQQYRKGTLLYWTAKTEEQKPELQQWTADIIQDDFWKTNPHLLSD